MACHLLLSALAACLLVLLSHLALASIPRLFPLTLLAMLPLSVLILAASVVLRRCIKWALGISTPAPAVVAFHILFIWGVYAVIVREGNLSLLDALINGGCPLLLYGLYRSGTLYFIGQSISRIAYIFIVVCHTGGLSYFAEFILVILDWLRMKVLVWCLTSMFFVRWSYSTSYFICAGPIKSPNLAVRLTRPLDILGLWKPLAKKLSSTNSALFERIRICDSCKARVKGFDHHCPAFGTCIGQKNHRLFMLLIIGFILVESSYISCSTQFVTKVMDTHRLGFEDNFSGSLIIGTLLFCILQLTWQASFLIWHIYCICVNIRTDEWINWRKYAEFQHVIQPQPGQSFWETKFINPYSKGIIGNIKDFLKTKD